MLGPGLKQTASFYLLTIVYMCILVLSLMEKVKEENKPVQVLNPMPRLPSVVPL